MNEIRTKGKSEGIMVALNRTGRKIYLLYQNYLVTSDTEQPYVIGFSQNVTARIEAERALKKSEEKYRSIIANMNLGLVEVDPEEYIVYANNSFCEMSGYTLDELIGGHAPTVLFDGAHYNSREVAARRLNGQSDAYELQVHNRQGEERWWLISGAPVLDENGIFKGSIGIHLDITLQKTLEQELRRAKADAEHSAHAKEVFLANMSHEIRTPMNAILGIARLLAKTRMDEQQEFYLGTIQNAAGNLLVLINDLLDFSKIEAGRIELEQIGFSLERVVSGAVQTLRHKAEEKSLQIAYEVSPQVVPVFIGDPYRINQILMNLLSNALKFTDSGSVQVHCSVKANNQSSQEILFRVTDTGIGISEEFIGHLFDKFTQEDETVTRRFGGTGLGMSICKQLVELMGGTIQVESRKNEGTTILFTLLLRKGTQADLPEHRSKNADTGILKGKRILLVEDNPVNRLVAHTVLKQYGAAVTEAADGAIAIEQLAQQSFDLILMDVQMPQKDGLETTRYIRSHLDKTIPIIALTANAFKEEEERCLQAGMNDFISKPFDEDQMVQMIAQWLGKDGANKLPAGNESGEVSPLQTESKGGNAPEKEKLQVFVNDISGCLHEMQQAYTNRDWNKLAGIAKNLKSMMRSLDVTSLDCDLQLLEQVNMADVDEEIILVYMNHIASVTGEIIQNFGSMPETGT
jgi:PAS domain S-box-containing protein